VTFAPGALNRWVFPTLLLGALAMAAATLIRRRSHIPRWWIVTVGVGAVWLIAGALMGENPAVQVMGTYPRYEGLVALPVYVGAFWLGAKVLGNGGSALRFTFLKATSVAAGALGIVAALQAWGASPIASDATRAGSLTGSATDQGLVGVAYLVVLSLGLRQLGQSARGAHLLLLSLGALGAAVAVALSASRSAYLALIAAVVVLAVCAVRLRARAAGELRGLLPLAVGAGVVVGVVAIDAAARSRALGTNASGYASDRPLIWGDTWEVAKSSLLTGEGPSGFMARVRDSHSPEWFAQVGDVATLDSPHNVLLQALVVGGVPTFVGLVVLVVATAVALWRALGAATEAADRTLIEAALAVGAATLTGFMFSPTSASAIVAAGVVVGAGLGARGKRAGVPGLLPERLAQRLRTPVATVFWAALALVLASAVAAEYALAGAATATTKGNDAAAVQDLSRAHTLRPWDPTVESIGGQLLAANARARQTAALGAVEWSDRALERLPGDLGALRAKGEALLAAERFDEAIAVYRGIVERRPYDMDAVERLAIAQWASGAPADALETVDAGLERRPDAPRLVELRDALVPVQV
jgi:O-antigen ligase